MQKVLDFRDVKEKITFYPYSKYGEYSEYKHIWRSLQKNVVKTFVSLLITFT